MKKARQTDVLLFFIIEQKKSIQKCMLFLVAPTGLEPVYPA